MYASEQRQHEFNERFRAAQRSSPHGQPVHRPGLTEGDKSKNEYAPFSGTPSSFVPTMRQPQQPQQTPRTRTNIRETISIADGRMKHQETLWLPHVLRRLYTESPYSSATWAPEVPAVTPATTAMNPRQAALCELGIICTITLGRGHKLQKMNYEFGVYTGGE